MSDQERVNQEFAKWWAEQKLPEPPECHEVEALALEAWKAGGRTAVVYVGSVLQEYYK